ncbi:MAG: hypothetical protein LUG91_01920 [Ruminococcus sp.]|nr:hypothetical protein [Ruminococcus sp.]
MIDDIKIFFEGMYSKNENPIVVFNKTGETFWQNAVAERFFAAEMAAPDEIFADILCCPNSSGIIHNGFGGRFNTAEFSGVQFFVAELYDDNHIYELMTDRRVADFVQKNDISVRKNISTISALCEELNYIFSESESKDYEQYLSAIIASCCRMLSNTIAGTMITELAADKGYNEKTLSVDAFVKDFAEGCKSAFDGRCDVRLGEVCGGFVKLNKSNMTYFLLFLLRRYVSYQKGGFYLNISSVSEDKNFKITVEAVPDDSELSGNIRYDMEENVDDSVLNIFARKLDAKYSFADGKLVVFIKSAENNGIFTLEAPRIYFGNRTFSPYNIVLNDCDNHKDFY